MDSLKVKMRYLMLERKLQVLKISERKRKVKQAGRDYYDSQDNRFFSVKRRFVASHDKRITELAKKIQRGVELDCR